MKTLVSVIGLFVLGVGALFLNLFVFMRLWEMIAVPMGAPMLTGYLQAYGLCLLFFHFISGTLATKEEKYKDKKGFDKALMIIMTSIVSSLFSWGIASILF